MTYQAQNLKKRILSYPLAAILVANTPAFAGGQDSAPPPPPVLVSPTVVDVFFTGITAILNLLDPAATVVSESVNKAGQTVTGIKLGTPADALNFEHQAAILSNMTPQQQMNYIDGINANGNNAK